MLAYSISRTEGPMDNRALFYTFACLRLLRARRAKSPALSENCKTKIALFLHHFCIVFQNRGDYKMQSRHSNGRDDRAASSFLRPNIRMTLPMTTIFASFASFAPVARNPLPVKFGKETVKKR